jgi:hypothetical protein
MIYADRAIKGFNTPIGMAEVLNQVQLSGVDSSAPGAASLVITISGYPYTYHLNNTDSIPTTAPTVTIEAGTTGSQNW